MEKKERPKVGVAAIVIKDGKVLMGKRQSPGGKGTWCFPGGHLEFGESWGACAARECKEETGVMINDPAFVGAVNDFMPDEGKHYVTIYMKGNYAGGEPQVMEPDKLSEIGWFDISNLPFPRFVCLKNFLKEFKLEDLL